MTDGDIRHSNPTGSVSASCLHCLLLAISSQLYTQAQGVCYTHVVKDDVLSSTDHVLSSTDHVQSNRISVILIINQRFSLLGERFVGGIVRIAAYTEPSSLPTSRATPTGSHKRATISCSIGPRSVITARVEKSTTRQKKGGFSTHLS